MPKLSSQVKELPVTDSHSETFFQMSFSGFIDAANYPAFENALENVCTRGGRFVVLDFSALNYINSTGISAIIRYFEQCKERSGLLCLSDVPKQVGLSMHLLGVTSLVPFVKNVEAARKCFQDHLEGRARAAVGEEDTEKLADGKRRTPVRRVTLRKQQAGLEDARVLLVHASRSRFSSILKKRFRRLDGRFHLIHDIKEALDRYDDLDPDLVVVDSGLDPKGEFVTRLKINKQRSLTSVIKIYEKKTDVEAEIDFKIWENDYLVDPFEVLELFTLSEAELLRVPRDRKVFQQQVRFEFRSNPENLEKANKLADIVIRQSLRHEEDQTALYAAVKEAIDNGIVHGHRKKENLTIDVNFLVDNRKITVFVEDKGKGFDFEYYLSRIDSREAFEKAKRRILKTGHRGGLGILLMNKCCDRLEYSGCGNCVRLEKNLRQ